MKDCTANCVEQHGVYETVNRSRKCARDWTKCSQALNVRGVARGTASFAQRQREAAWELAVFQSARAWCAKGSRRVELFLRVTGSADRISKSVAERSAGYAVLCDNGGDVARWSYVESYVGGGDVRGSADSGCVRDFVWGALFDGDLIAAGERQINGGDGRGDVERDVIFFG